MKHKYIKQLLPFLLLFSILSFAQNTKNKQKITKNYNLTKLENLKEQYSKDFHSKKNKALLIAAQKGWKVNFTDSKGSYHELMGVTKEGKPLYYKTHNATAAISTRANFLHNNGGLGLNIEGQNMTAHVWDQGLPNVNHQEYDGAGGENRVSVGDGTTALSDHGAHVMGTIISSGFEAAAKGMAPQAKGISYDWTNDESEAAAAAAAGMLVSNHSYGIGFRDDEGEVQIPTYYFGAYISGSRNWDEIMYNAPYYLMVSSAGNDGNDNTANVDPTGGNNLYDKLTDASTAKNNLVVANGQDAVINADGSLGSVLRNSSSSEGSTDDLRIKPDIMGNGTGVYSTLDSADDVYASYSGTSMASPNVAGSLLLLQQYYNQTNNSFMKAATLKGLALHTADDAADVGPDVETGWGLLNTKKAAETITNNNFQSLISEIEITQGETYTLVVNSDEAGPLLASISWTDLPGRINTGIINDATPVLINDIDIRVTKNTEENSEVFMPWKLSSVTTNEKGDNIVDPYERVEVENASGEYTITISHKGLLAGGSQKVSLIVTGIIKGIALLTNESDKTSCATTASFDFNYLNKIGGTTNFSVNGKPENLTVSFSDNSLTTDSSLTATFGNLENVLPGLYTINVVGTNGSETTITPVKLRVIHPSFSGQEVLPSFPLNGARGVTSAKFNLAWEKNNNAESYQIEVSDSPTFTTILLSENTVKPEVTMDGLQSDNIYYWRVKPENSCVSGAYSKVYSFQTGISDCSNRYVGTDFTNRKIDIIAGSSAFVPLNVTDDLIIDRILVTTTISHSYVADMVISLEGPESLGSTNVILLSNPCGEIADIKRATFDDAANDLSCSSIAPAISGSIAPINNMSLPFAGKSALGEWKLKVFDGHDEDGGQINGASLSICTLQTNTNIPSLAHSDITVDRNSSYSISSADMNASTSGDTEVNQVYTLIALPANGQIELNAVVLSVGDKFNQQEINSGSIKYVNTKTSSFSDEFTVDVRNSSNGWLPNNVIKIKEATLSLDNNNLEGVSFWPNPAKDILNIKMINSDNSKITISLFDLQGRKIVQTVEESRTNTFTNEINIKNVSSGVYLLTVEQGGKKATKKIIISN